MKENISNKSLRIAVVILSLLLIWCLLLESKNTTQIDGVTKSTIDSLNYLNDSLENELFIQTTNVTRYEIALDKLKEEDSVSAQKFEDALFNIE